MTAAEVLRAARDMISDPKNWTRHQNARDAAGNPVLAWSADAVCWCSYGAVEAADPKYSTTCDPDDFLHSAVDEKCPGLGVAEFNDSAEHADVLAVFDRAIEIAEAQS